MYHEECSHFTLKYKATFLHLGTFHLQSTVMFHSCIGLGEVIKSLLISLVEKFF